MRTIVLFIVGLSFFGAKGQFAFSGNVDEENQGKSIYLSLVEDYRKSSRIYLDQIIMKTTVDSIGHFRFEGDHLPLSNRMYRIHLDLCEEGASSHFLGHCGNSPSVLFIANNSDSISFPTSFENQALCTIESTNPGSQHLLEIDMFKEEMVFDFTEFRSDTNLKLNSKKWFAKLQQYGENCEEPLAELYIFDFLSDKRNETYGYYLSDIVDNPYYQGLQDRLERQHPNTSFTQQYNAEVRADKQLAGLDSSSFHTWKWILISLLTLSLGTNVFFILRSTKSTPVFSSQKLTPQEKKIVDFIKQGKSNKEIAASLFVSHSTVKTHINNLYKKLNVSNREAILELLEK